MGHNGRKIALTWVWLAGLVIFLHAVIPHHHHYTSDESCLGKEKSGVSLVADISHSCHAFNELINEEGKSRQLKVNETSGYSQILLSSKNRYDLPVCGEETDYSFYREDLKSFLFFTDCQPVRGSPV